MTVAELDPLFPKYRNKGLLLDANLLLLYLVGELDVKLVPSFKRTRAFTVEDFLLLKAVVSFFPILVTIPGVLAEVNSLAGHLDGRRQTAFRTLFERKIRVLKEDYAPSREAAYSPAFRRLGLTDAAIILACRDKYLALSADFPLTQFVESNFLDVVNFNHIRFQDWD